MGEFLDTWNVYFEEQEPRNQRQSINLYCGWLTIFKPFNPSVDRPSNSRTISCPPECRVRTTTDWLSGKTGCRADLFAKWSLINIASNQFLAPVIVYTICNFCCVACYESIQTIETSFHPIYVCMSGTRKKTFFCSASNRSLATTSLTCPNFLLKWKNKQMNSFRHILFYSIDIFGEIAQKVKRGV